MEVLVHRKEDLHDLLKSIKGQKAEEQALMKELGEIEEELFELEKKYGECKEKEATPEMKAKEEEEKTELPEQTELSQKEEEPEAPEVESISPSQAEGKSKEELLSLLKAYKEGLKHIEDAIQKAAEDEDFEKADELQQEADRLEVKIKVTEAQLPEGEKESSTIEDAREGEK